MPRELTRAHALAFDNELRKIKSEVLKQDVPDLEGMELFDTETDLEPGMKEYGVDMLTQTGQVSVISNTTDKIEYAEVGLYRDVYKVIALGNGYRWSYMEALSLANTGKVPRRLRGVAARDVMLQEHNDIAINGKAAYGVHGVLTFPGVPRHQFTTTFSSTDSADDILADMFDHAKRPITATKNVHKPSIFTYPLAKYLEIATRARTSGLDTTILEFFTKQIRGIIRKEPVIQASWMLEDANVAMVHSKGQTGHAKLVIPGRWLWQQLPVQAQGYGFDVPCLGFNGGWYTEYPQRMCIGEFAS